MALVVLLSGSSVTVLPPIAVHRQQGMHAGNMVSVTNIAGDAVRCGSLEVLQVDYRTFHAG